MNENHLLMMMFTLVFLITTLLAEDTNPMERIENGTSKKIDNISYISRTPLIDGVLDNDLSGLEERFFNEVFKKKNCPLTPVSYRIAYNAEFLYVYIEATGDRLSYRDRAYQNGDGFVMLIANALKDNEMTPEFYELACSAVNHPTLEWSRHIFWNYNVDEIFKLTGDKTQMECKEQNGKICFELCLPWASIRPYHPWLSDRIGFNLSFCKAQEQDECSWHTLIDGNIGAEFSKRGYLPMSFDIPTEAEHPMTFLSPFDGHVFEGDSLKLNAVTLSSGGNDETIIVEILSGEGETVLRRYFDYPLQKGLTHKELMIPLKKLSAGGYQVKWKAIAGGQSGYYGLTVLSSIDFNRDIEMIKTENKQMSISTIHTLEFMNIELNGRILGLKHYETAYNPRQQQGKLKDLILHAKEGNDLLMKQRGFIRKAYLSKIDDTFQPYVVYIPEDYQPDKKYPLMVFLHGSASDETNIQGFRSLIPEGFIGLGVKGRGPSNGFCRDHAQDDIAEAIMAVERDYSIDESRLLLTGFSMGGYGVYRTYFQTPDKFKAIAVFSGEVILEEGDDPVIGKEGFTDLKVLHDFKNLPVFIFHGEKDLNVSLSDVKKLYVLLKKTGAKCELVIEPNKGHDQPNEDNLKKYQKWVKDNFK